MNVSYKISWHLMIVSLALLTLGSLNAQVPELINGGFETTQVIEELPDVGAGWGGDVGEFVTAENGISPFEGQQMLKYMFTARDESGVPIHGEVAGANLYQGFDLRPFQSEVDAGLVTASMSARVNRVLGDDQTDNEFTYGFFGFDASDRQTFRSDVRFRSDGDPATWQLISRTSKVLEGTAFLWVSVSASENVVNDLDFPEFDGHYVDDVRVSIAIPEPCSLVLAGIGASICICGVRHRRP